MTQKLLTRVELTEIKQLNTHGVNEEREEQEVEEKQEDQEKDEVFPAPEEEPQRDTLGGTEK